MTLTTHTGLVWDFGNLSKCVVDVRDVARALSNLCRFGGHTRQFYSVAQHSVLCSYTVPGEYAAEALIHDAHEAYVVDIPAPLKERLPDYRDLEAVVEAHVRAGFAFYHPLSPAVHAADMDMRELEKAALVATGKPDSTGGTKLHPIGQDCWEPDEAEANFLSRFKQLYQRRSLHMNNGG